MNIQFVKAEMGKINYLIQIFCICMYIITKILLLLLTKEGRAGKVSGFLDPEECTGHGKTRISILDVVGFQSIFLETSDGELCLTRYHEDVPAERRELKTYISPSFIFTLSFSKSRSHFFKKKSPTNPNH